MTAEQAAAYNDAFPFTVAPCDCCQSFEKQSFSTLEAAREYRDAQAPKPACIALPSGALVQ